MDNWFALATSLWHQLGWPLIRLLFFVSIGLLVANFIEAFNWTRTMARVAAPLIRTGRFSDIVGASFSMALISGVSANTMLSEAYEQKKIAKKELVLANLFNSLPRFFLHLPTVFFLTAPLIKAAAFIYVGLTFAAALVRTLLIMVVGRLMLSGGEGDAGRLQNTGDSFAKASFRDAAVKTWKRFKKRIRRIVFYMVPIYTVIFFLNRVGIFALLKKEIAGHITFLSWLRPESVGIVVLHVAAEFTAGLAAAGALVDAGTLGARDVVLALLVGNVLSSPIRAIRHQLPYYAGIFSPRLAVELVFCSQAFRIGSIILVTAAYFFITA